MADPVKIDAYRGFRISADQSREGEINQRIDIRAEAKRLLDQWRSDRMFAAECEMFVCEP